MSAAHGVNQPMGLRAIVIVTQTIRIFRGLSPLSIIVFLDNAFWETI